MKWLRIWLSLLVVLLLAGCGRTGTPLEEGETMYQIYYLNGAMTRLVPQEYRTKEQDTDLLIQEMMDQIGRAHV